MKADSVKNDGEPSLRATPVNLRVKLNKSREFSRSYHGKILLSQKACDL